MGFLPRIFSAGGFRVNVAEPTLVNLQFVPDHSIFKEMPGVKVFNIEAETAARYRREFPASSEKAVDEFDFDILFRYGLFRLAPPALRFALYYKGRWWRDGQTTNYSLAVTEFSQLYYLPELCRVDQGEGTLNILYNDTTHEAGAYQADLLPHAQSFEYSNDEVKLFGSPEDAAYMYAYLAALDRITVWLNWLKERGVYDNTTIIIVSDHGARIAAPQIEAAGLVRYNPLLLVKQPNRRGPLEVRPELRTNADVPGLALQTLEAQYPDRPVINPYLNRPPAGPDYQEIIIAENASFQPDRHGPYLYKINAIRRLLNPDDVFKESSWSPWETYRP
jgi:hypothetical protein